MNYTVGIIGLGRMGSAVATRLAQHGHTVIGYDPLIKSIDMSFVELAGSLPEVADKARIFWLMVPAGDTVDTVLSELSSGMKEGDIVIDGGNSFFKDSIRRYQNLGTRDIYFFDCGTSGGVHGRELGFSLMIGGDYNVYQRLLPLWQAVATHEGYGWVGPAGAGHYVKMVHNGIEYALLQAYA
ncbi:MAG TPA: NAD(P)-binding domain-containing protein, partial [Candidatus Babeliaceae bacterium]|nr:NAD(P)-binding domain-containing protein [Candidatus Babeliaceae bacterium]